MSPLGLLGLALFLGAVVLVLVLRERAHVEKRFTVYFSAGELEKALPYARRLAARRAEPLVRGRRQLNLGSLLMKLGEWKDAERAFTDARGTLLASVERGAHGEPVVSGREEEEALAFGLPTAIHNLAWLSLAKGDLASARERARELEDARSQVIEAACRLVDGNAPGAVELISPSFEKMKGERGHGLAFAVLSAAHSKLGDAARSRECALLARERLTEPHRKEMRALFPGAFGFL
ncbi:hypothetical protein HY251_08685 [bacterium]|nr:hypothetical protein [bacterium]